MAIVNLPVEVLSVEWMGEEQDTLLRSETRHVIFTVGVSASGKTTWAKKFCMDWCVGSGWKTISRDGLRASICQPFSWKAWKRLGSKGEKMVNELQSDAVDEAIWSNRNVIICDTNLNAKNFNHLSEKFKSAGYKVYFKFFPVDWKTAVERDNARENGVGISVLAQQFERLHALERKDLLKRGGRAAVLCDIDGTLAHMTTRGPYDYDKVDTDSLDDEIFDILRGLSRLGYAIVIVSGRDGICKEDTYNWLLANLRNVPFHHYQRAVGDKRPDDVIKEELLKKIIDDGFCPKMVFDDRPRCFRMWQKLGLKTFIVSNPYIEF